MTALITLFAPLLHAFSTGGGLGFIQLCDAVDFCSSGTCPRGMHLVAPPTRSSVYQLRTGDLQPVAQDPTSYVPGELVKVYVRVTSRMIPAKYEAGARTGRNESAKYLGILLYAVRLGDMNEEKIGFWELPPNEPAKFWRPPDLPGCDGKAVMHADAEPKHYLEMFQYRAPPAGTGAIIFRALVIVD